ncbi:hypothetical protein B484DRAFT_339961, partial [Ochromonadaceae sp. CCMP2298]
MSLKPEVEFELLKLILLREKYIQRLAKRLAESRTRPYNASSLPHASKAAAPAQERQPSVDIGLIGLLDVLRECTLQTVETIRLWERTQLSYPDCKPYRWNGQNYLHKLFQDLDFLSQY